MAGTILAKEQLPVLETLGYDFICWKDGETEVTADSYKVVKNVTFTAFWKEHDAHLIQYNNVENLENPNPDTFKETQTITLTAVSKNGYTFNGWYTDKDFAEGTNTAGWTAGEKTADVVLYAKFTPNKYILTLNPNGGTTSDSENPSYEITYGTKFELPECDFTFPQNNKFLCWSTQKNCEGTTYNPGDTFEIGTENITLYAIWTSAENITVTISTESDIKLSVQETSNNEYTLTVDAGYDSYTWKIDGVKSEETGNVLTIDASKFSKGTYFVNVIAVKGTKVVSAMAQIKVAPRVE